MFYNVYIRLATDYGYYYALVAYIRILFRMQPNVTVAFFDQNYYTGNNIIIIIRCVSGPKNKLMESFNMF